VNDATPTATPRNRRAPICRCAEGEIEKRIEPTTKITALIRCHELAKKASAEHEIKE